MNLLTVSSFKKIVDDQEIDNDTQNLINTFKLHYREVNINELNNIILKAIKSNRSVAGFDRKNEWEDGWHENLKNFLASKDIKDLKPKYYRSNQYLRFNGNWIYTPNSDFEFSFFQIIRSYLFNKYIYNHDIFEFGCGSGLNVAYFAKKFPYSRIFGLDWSKNSVQILNNLCHLDGFSKVSGIVFDMFEPSLDLNSLNIINDFAFVTIGGMEQIGDSFYDFFNFIFNKNPEICIHIEPIIEQYNQDSLFDYLAMDYHKSCGYLGEYLTYLKKNKNVKIINYQKISCGLYHDGWNIICWRPIKSVTTGAKAP